MSSVAVEERETVPEMLPADGVSMEMAGTVVSKAVAMTTNAPNSGNVDGAATRFVVFTDFHTYP